LKAIVVRQHGGPEVLKLENVPIPIPQEKEILVKNRAIGVNFVDTQHRAGLNYPVNLPLIPGTEAAGIVETVGQGVSEFKVGDRVGYAGYMGGNYAEFTVVPEDKLVPVPDNVTFELAAASLLQGMTAHFMAYSVYHIKEKDIVLIQAAAGGVGLF
jgi:NADPH2:quinone reductase